MASPFLAASPGDLADLGRKVVSGVLPVEIRQVYPFECAAQAFVDQLQKHNRGKRVVVVGDAS